MRRFRSRWLHCNLGTWQTGVGRTLRGLTLGISSYGRIGSDRARATGGPLA